MNFRTEVFLQDSVQKIEPSDRIFSVGSCFAVEMSALFAAGQLQTLANPFGTLFNPLAVKKAVQKIHDADFYTEADLVSYRENYISLDHHTDFSSRFAHQTLEKINRKIEEGNEFLRQTKWVLITFGSAFSYEFLPKKLAVANCHKIPAKYFEKKLLPHAELTASITETIAVLKDICVEDVQLLFTVSPVRHTKDGLAENSLSKAHLLTALHEVIQTHENCRYLPIYEIMMDDLRDYRFYADDLIHPNSQALRYIWEKFEQAYFSETTRDFIKENLKIAKGFQHRPQDEKSPAHKEFLGKLQQQIKQQQAKVSHRIFPSFITNF